MNRLFLTITLLVFGAVGLRSSLAIGTDVNNWAINSVGANSKLVLKTDLIVPANQNGTTWKGGEHYTDPSREKAFACHIFTRETSLNSRVLRAGTELVFTGEVTERLYSEGDEGSIKCYDFQLSHPEAVDRVHCIAFTFYQAVDGETKVKPREATLGELIRFFRGGADFFLAGPVELVNPSR